VTEGGSLHARAYYGAMKGDESFYVTPCGQRGRLDDEGVEVFDASWEEAAALDLPGVTGRCKLCRELV